MQRFDLHSKDEKFIRRVEVGGVIESVCLKCYETAASSSELNIFAVREKHENGERGFRRQPTAERKFPANGTINRELKLLQASFNYARKRSKKITVVPVFDFLPEAPPRDEELRDEDYPKLSEACAREGLWMRALLEWYCTFGWRKNEPTTLVRVRQIDLLKRQVLLGSGRTKGKEGRRVTMTPALFELVKSLCEGKNSDDLVFTRIPPKTGPTKGKHLPVGDFRKR